MGDTTKAREVMLSKRSKYEDAYQYYLINQNKGESMRSISQKFGVDVGGFTRYIKKQESTQESTPISHAIEGIKGGLEIIKNLQESTLDRDKEIAQKAIATLEEYYPQMRSIFAGIQNRVLNALDRETQRMEVTGELDLKGIAQTQAVLKMVNDTNYFNQRTPLVAVQNNIQNNASGSAVNTNGNMLEDKGDSEIKIVYEIVHSSADDKEKAMQDDDNQSAIDAEVID